MLFEFTQEYYYNIIFDCAAVGCYSIGCLCLLVVGLRCSELYFEVGPRWLISSLAFHFSTASVKIFAFVMIIFPMLMSCYGLSGVLCA